MDDTVEVHVDDPPYQIGTARYAKGMLIVRCPSADGFKTRAARLIGDGLRGRWTSRESGYIASPTKVERFKRLFAEGWDACTVTKQLEPPEGRHLPGRCLAKGTFGQNCPHCIRP